MKNENNVVTEVVETPSVAVIALGTKNVSIDCKIECVPNPKRVGSKAHARYAIYGAAKTVKEYLDLGGLKADMKYDFQHQFLILKEQIVNGKVVKIETK